MGASDEIVIPGTKVVDSETPPNLMRKLVLEDSKTEPVAPSHNPKTYNLIKSARQELAEWLPQWGKKPQKDTRAEEHLAALQEDTAERVKQFVPVLRDEKNRIRNIMSLADFCRKLNNILGPAADLGSRIFINTPPAVAGFDNEKMKGLFIKMRGMDMFTYHEDLPPGWKKICTVQNPYMSEWGVMNRDAHGAFRSWKYIGWRGQVLLRLILGGAITEEEAHKEFGVPQGVEVDREYLKILNNWRNHGERPN